MTRIVGEEPKPEQELIRARQRERARIMAWLLGGFVLLLFLITLAKIGTHL
jgi:hypothetical protein